MLITSFDPFFRQLDREFDRLVARGWRWEPAQGGALAMDVLRRKDDVLIRFDLPGADPESIDITVEGGVLTVSASRAEENDETARYYARERRVGTVSRAIRLSDRLDSDKIEASYVNGILTLRIPVAEQAKARKVEIKSTDLQALDA